MLKTMAIISDFMNAAATRYKQREEKRKTNLIKLQSEDSLKKDIDDIEGKDRITTRLKLIHPNDGLALERIIGKSDLLDVNYLDLGQLASKSVCRIQVRDSVGRSLGHGTGFMVSPNLLLTNNHVLDSMERSRKSLAEFNFEDDHNFIPKPVKIFSIEPEQFFYTDVDLDFTLVAVRPKSTNETSLKEFGYLRLVGDSGKALLGEHVSIIQHPNGRPKSITLRENKVVDVFDNYVHYVSDTQRGSSGSPVFNDQWLVLALHHSSVLKRDAAGNPLTVDNQLWTPDMGEEKLGWIANEGVRISRILNHLKEKSDWTQQESQFVSKVWHEPDSDLLYNDDVVTKNTNFGSIPDLNDKELDLSAYTNKSGYDPDFLTETIPLPQLSEHLLDDVVELDEGGNELKYTHFSIVMSKSRQLAYFTAVNIDGNDTRSITRTSDYWYMDPRIPKKFQSGKELYVNNPLDKGHLVKRLEPVWGDLAKEANDDTFHYTNSAPQHKNLNRKTWKDLENYILSNTDKHDLRISVFTGPIFRADDMLYRGEFQVPAEYWKIAVMVKDNGKLSATGYLQTQKNLIENLEFAFGEYKTYQIPITKIESLTQIDFGKLRVYDPMLTIEGTVGREIYGHSDILL